MKYLCQTDTIESQESFFLDLKLNSGFLQEEVEKVKSAIRTIKTFIIMVKPYHYDKIYSEFDVFKCLFIKVLLCI
jgi:hypothetical protein